MLVAVTIPPTNMPPPTPTPPTTCRAPVLVEFALVALVALIPPAFGPALTQFALPSYSHVAYGLATVPTWIPLLEASAALVVAVPSVMVLSPVAILVLLTVNEVPSTYKSPVR